MKYEVNPTEGGAMALMQYGKVFASAEESIAYSRCNRQAEIKMVILVCPDPEDTYQKVANALRTLEDNGMAWKVESPIPA
jgi:hypothetical protein